MTDTRTAPTTRKKRIVLIDFIVAVTISQSMHLKYVTLYQIARTYQSSDECQNCARSILSSDKELISSLFLRFFIVFQCLLIIFLNGKGLKHHLLTSTHGSSKMGKIDRILCVQLCVYDFIIGVYLFVICFKMVQYSGKYCSKDIKWRTSRMCDINGFLFSFSAHGSLVTSVTMALTRCYNCVWFITNTCYRKQICCFVLLNILYALYSIFPLLPFYYLEVMLTSNVFLKNNPILTKADNYMLSQILLQHKNQKHAELLNMSTSKLLDKLQNITSNRSIFEVTGRLGFYTQSPLCIQNLFSIDELSRSEIFVFFICPYMDIIWFP